MNRFTTRPLVAALAFAALAAGNAWAAGTVTGISTAVPKIKLGESTTAIVQGTASGQNYNKGCSVRITMQYPDNTKEVAHPHYIASTFPQPDFYVKPTKPGKVKVIADGNTASNGWIACQGMVQTELIVEAPVTASIASTLAPAIIMATSLTCPTGYEKVGENPAKGEIKCRKLPAACPAHFEGSVDSSNGKLVCTPKPASCPDGWQGGMQGGILNCTSVPQPSLPCPDKTQQWKWGSSYYKEGWRFMGCSANLEPAK